MHEGNWHEGWNGGSWTWIPMVVMMIAFWGGLVWIGLTLLKRGNHTPMHLPATSAAPVPPRPSAQEILAERLARGEIESDDYRQRLDALHHTPGA